MIITRIAFVAALLCAGAARAQEPLQIKLAQGSMRGAVQDGVASFRAIPYAAAPVGLLRFRSPQAPKPWYGLRDATKDGPACPQTQSGDPAGKASVDEDCLLLNVFAPSPVSTKLPVMVWIHGGGFNIGFSGARQYDPSPLVKEGGIVVVSINYRLGTLGLLATKSLDAKGAASGNYAIRDQQAALRWVRTNIAAFGGDPRNVTIAGESAGAASVLALVSSPLSKGLFQRAIAQSTPNDTHAVRRADGEQKGAALAVTLGCPDGPGQANCLRQLPVDAILKVRSGLGLVQDGQVLPRDPYAALRDGKFNHVPMIIGTNLHEGWFFVSSTERRLGHPMTEAEYAAEAKSAFGDNAEAVMRQYPASSRASAAAAIGDAHGDLRFSCYAELARTGAAKYAPVYGYEMNEPNPAQQQPRQKFSLDNTDYHTSDLAYLFDYDSAPLTGTAAMLGRTMRSYWINFIRNGSPGAAWPQYRPGAGTLLNLSNSGGTTSDFAARHNCSPLFDAGLVSWEPK